MQQKKSAQLKVVNLNPERTLEDRIKQVINNHTELLEKECNGLLLIAMLEGKVLLITSDPIYTYRELLMILEDAKIAVNEDLIEEALAHALGQK